MSRMEHHGRRLCRRALTSVELSIGLAVFGLVAAAISAVVCAAADGWTDNAARGELQMRAAQLSARFVPLVRSASRVLLAVADDQRAVSGSSGVQIVSSPGSGACLMLWHDTDADGVMVAREITLIERKAPASTLLICTYPPTGPGANVVFSLANTDDSADAAAFSNMPGVVRRTLAESIAGASFSVGGTGSTVFRQTLNYRFTLAAGGRQRAEAGTVCVRASARPS